MQSEVWVEERFEDSMGTRFRVDNILFSGRSNFQAVDVVQTRAHGKMLLNDGLVMLTERDEFIYHEMITHVPLMVHPNPRRVLVIGGGDGGTAREVLRHSSVDQCVMVEIDALVVDACREHIPVTSSVFTHPKLDLRIQDGIEFVAQTKDKFDVVIVDSTDPIGPAAPLFNHDFYRNIFKCLSDNGIVVSQGESPFYHQEMQKTLVTILHDIFPVSGCYNFTNMSYPGGFWSFSWGSKGLHPLKNFDASRVVKSELDFQYYNSDIHCAAFALPSFQRKNLAGLLKGF